MIASQNTPQLPDKTKEEEIKERREKVNELLGKGWSEKKIALELKVSYITIVRDVKELKERTFEWVDEQARTGYMFECKKCIDEIDNLKSTMYDMLYDSNSNPELKLKISKEIREILRFKIERLEVIPTIQGVNNMVKQIGRVPQTNPHYANNKV